MTLERRQSVPDGGGGNEVSWVALATVWAKVEEVRGQERVVADRLAGTVTYLVTLRNAGAGAGVTVADRLVWGGQALDIRRAAPGQRSLYRTIEAEAGVSADAG